MTSIVQRDTLPNAVFSPDPSSIGSNALISPSIPILSTSARLTFHNSYSLESPNTGTIGYDGGVLEIKIGAGLFQDILAAGGSFVTNGYKRTISSSFSNPLAGRQAWSGNSGGFVTTIVNLPAAAAGQNIQLRWRCGSDSSVGSTGWYIDTVFISDALCCTGTVNHPPVINAAAIVPGSPTTTNDLVASVTSTNDPDNNPITLTYQWQESTNNVSFTNIAFTAATLPASATTAGDYYLVIITPSDGITNGAPFTTSSVHIPVDADGNGLNDDWEVTYFGHIGVDPNADPDGDGFSNAQEYQLGTSPVDANSTLKITSIVVTGDDVAVTWSTAGGHTNIVQEAPDPSGNYSNISLNIVIPGTVDTSTNYLDPGAATNGPTRFYRIKLVP